MNSFWGRRKEKAEEKKKLKKVSFLPDYFFGHLSSTLPEAMSPTIIICLTDMILM